MLLRTTAKVIMLSALNIQMLGSTPVAAAVIGSTFTYQGRLDDGGRGATGNYDLQFQLYDALTGGQPIGSPLTLGDVPVQDGLFTVMLNFDETFGSTALFLQIGVRPGDSSGAFSALNPRQALTANPYALYSLTAALAASVQFSNILGLPAGFLDGVDNDSGGDITAVSAGPGLIGGSVSGDAVLEVSFSGSGSAGTASRSDHDHIGQYWSGSQGTTVAASSGAGLVGISTAPGGVGVRGQGHQGVSGLSFSPDGTAVFAANAATTGSAVGVHGTTAAPSGIGVLGVHGSSIGTGPGVKGVTFSNDQLAVGVLGVVESSGLADGSAAVRGINDSVGNESCGVWGSVAGRGRGVHGNSVGGTGVSGWAQGDALGRGYGVHGGTSATKGAGVLAQGAQSQDPNAIALEIRDGGIKVKDAGLNTDTPAFVHRAAVGNTAFNATTIDHPLTNGDPYAILIVTPNHNPGGTGGTFNDHPIAVVYLGGQWAIWNQDTANMPLGAAFNVLVIKR